MYKGNIKLVFGVLGPSLPGLKEGYLYKYVKDVIFIVLRVFIREQLTYITMFYSYRGEKIYFVVIIITPFFAFSPYCLKAKESGRIVMAFIVCGSTFFMSS